MSNYLGRKTEFTPSVYTRYFEQSETSKSSKGHVYFNDHEDEVSNSYQVKRDLLFKRLFPSKYADSNNNKTGTEKIHQNGHNHAAQSLGDYISLSNDQSSTQKKRSSSPLADVILSSSDEHDDELLIEEPFPNSKHKSIVGHVHPRSVIENIRTILIRELYQQTSDPHTEWLKCKMQLARDYIHPRYYADFQRRYQKEIKRKKKSNSTKHTTDSQASVLDLTATSLTDEKSIVPISPMVTSNNSPELIVLDSDETDDSNEETQSRYFIDRSSTTLTTTSQPTSTSNEDYQKEDSKYAQLPTRNASSPSIIRPILSKNQRKKQRLQSTTPLVSAIDRIIDHMDQADPTKIMEEENLLLKQMKKRKKKKKNKLVDSTGD